MQERERARLQKMGTSSLQTDSLLQSQKKRSFRLPSFSRRSSAGERHVEVEVEVARSEEEMAARSVKEAARVQKAAAWQWYSRGVGEAVLPTKRPPLGKPPIDGKSVVNGSRSKAITDEQKKPLEPPLAESPRAASRFKAEARLAPLTSAAPSARPSDGPSTPLYDEFELSGLRTQMADFVQRLQLHQQTKDDQQSPAAQKPDPRKIAVDNRPHPVHPAPASVSIDHQHTKAPPAPAAPISSDHQLTNLPPSAALVQASTIPFHMRPFSALQRLFRKVVSGPIIKSTKKSPPIIHSSPAVNEPEVLPDEEKENYTPYHYHHYIHHHHHHYHYAQSPEESVAAAIIRSRRRHSESSSIRPHIPSQLEADSDEEEVEVERGSIEAYFARRRRHSDSFAGHLTPQKAAFDEEEKMKGESAKEALPMQLPRRYNSERFSTNKIPTIAGKDVAQPATDEFDEVFLEISSRRRHSAENQREGESLERNAEGGVKNGGGTYKLRGGTYKLGGAAEGATPMKPLVRRRHSEVLQRPEGVHYEMGKRTPSPWHSPSARYLEDIIERQIGVSAIFANAGAPARRRRPSSDSPAIYPQ